ncbi:MULTISPECIES: hypothetical protein [unclassified Gilliamella]|uniref:hypothetical protein n=1 Tax=unclassified Gilliamella TaxID=2685620 RepID=UPI0013254E30|nr:MULTISPECIES: hypothetical protein [unclassified Gilliamella]MWN30969.1 hypothetical protein [Gilliamella sp. Pra-s60]MWP28466.1 hypothetical protein [Gilliamella sp. Pra-s54]
MGDMGDAFREMRENYKLKRHARLDKNMEIIEQCNLQYKIDTNYTVLFKTQNGTLSFYPTKNKFMIKNKIYCGGAKSVLGFIKNMNKVK